ncbi:nucleoside-diphosphate-sugar epimerase/spore maturation protein CgeB [Brevundimonas alba]|uniref:Nucleoside-diphosphate-sugar epimerase/spore maturation protein CgeB n=1 Tax=Brevundimonas alba TaxID=74314 RepID=A0A7X6BMH5_9CAUL|nr:bifunctional glycosyltransferase/UDP-glucuronate decarboxylase [Brevundimonas alba]NJC40357.1 nucleoside-diphosphate-sugar epimerase/spore maturation protein CgeB [Brevundimonas alba]
MSRPMNIVVLGLSLSSSWGNGHAVTFRALLKAMAERGHRILFLERETPWYAAHRDLENPDYCELEFYDGLDGLKAFAADVAAADAVIVGSYVPDGIAVGDWARRTAQGVVAFYDIDTPVTLARLERHDCDYLSPRQIPDYDVYFSFTGGPTLERIERTYGSPAARALYCSADPDVYRPVDAPRRWDLSYLGTWSEDRQPVLERLLIEPARRLPQMSFVVAGPQYPDDIDWPANVQRIDHVPPADHPAFYAASRFTLNATRADMVEAGFSPSIRLFEAAACAAPVISDVWDGLGQLFTPDREIVLARSADDVVAALQSPPSEGRRMGLAARERILAAHTPAHRAETVERELLAAHAQRGDPLPARSTETSMRNVTDRKSVLVAGGAGFLGSHLCDRLLADGHHVVCLDNLQTGDLANLEQAMKKPNFEFVRHDVVDPLPVRLAERRFDRVYDLACAASPPQYQADPEHTMLTCVVGVTHLLQLAQRSGARFLLTSTSEIYGDPEVHPQPETYRGNVNPIGPRACYDEGKRAAETLTFDYDRAGRGEVRVARIFNTYGPRLSAADGRVVSNVVSQALADQPITVFGDGSQTRSFCYVDDMIGGLIALMEHDGPQPGPINLGNPVEMTVSRLVEVVLDLTGSSSEVTYQTLPIDDPRRRRPDIARAAEVLDWRPTTPLEEGLRRTIDWFDGERLRSERDAAAAVGA